MLSYFNRRSRQRSPKDEWLARAGLLGYWKYPIHFSAAWLFNGEPRRVTGALELDRGLWH